jgi:hypothetical protein
LTLEIWGRLFFLGQSIDEVDAQLRQLERARTTKAG